MSNIIFKTRTLLKNGTEEQWNKVKNFIPKEGEMLIYNPDQSTPVPRIKVGNGIDLPKDLPFVQTSFGEIIADKVKHKLIFGADQVYEYDGSKEVVVPVYSGNYSIN